MAIEFAVRGDYIQLDQLLKATGMVDSGGAAHAAVEEGRVRVDGALESRKRAKLRPGQRVRFGDEEIVLVANPEEGRVSLDNTEGGYRVTLEWDHTVLRHLLVWMSNRGRPFAPWGGTNVCLGVEPVTAAFDLGESVSAADNPLDAEGIPTVVALSPESDLVIRHGIGVDLLP